MSCIKTTEAEDFRRQRDFETRMVRLYIRHACTLLASYPDWKYRDEYYFIQLPLNMLAALVKVDTEG